MPEILHDAVSADRVHVLARPTAVLDDATSAVLAAAVEDARTQAYREGEAAGRAAATGAADRAAAAVTGAIGSLLDEVRGQLAQATARNLEFVTEVATAVLERTPPDDALTVLDRVNRAMEGLDELALQVRLHPEDHAVLCETAAAGAQIRDLELIADPGVARGDARIVGASSGAELTRHAMLHAAIGILAEDGS